MKKFIILSALITLSFSCSGNNDSEKSNIDRTLAEQAQSIGELMSSIDEMGGSDGSYAHSLQTPSPKEQVLFFQNWLIPSAYAQTCRLADTFGECTDNVIIRSFNNCRIGNLVFSGSITFTFDDSSLDNTCSLASNGDSISRKPNYAITYLGRSYTVSTLGSQGQVVTQISLDNYQFSSDGIRRVVRDSSDQVTYDFSSETLSAINISGTNRNNRIVDGGEIQITNNLTNRICRYTPDNITYSSDCNCPVSGSWLGNCNDTNQAEITISGCGTGIINVGNQGSSVSFDNCQEL